MASADGCNLRVLILRGSDWSSDSADHSSLGDGPAVGDPNFVSLFEHALVGIFVKFLSRQFITDWRSQLSMPHPEYDFGTMTAVQWGRTWTDKMNYFSIESRDIF